MPNYTLSVNDKMLSVDADADTPLLWVLRDNLNLVGTKFGCGVAQCGYCQAGQLMSAAALLINKPNPSDEEIDTAMTNICRCGTHVRIRKAIHLAAEKLNSK